MYLVLQFVTFKKDLKKKRIVFRGQKIAQFKGHLTTWKGSFNEAWMEYFSTYLKNHMKVDHRAGTASYTMLYSRLSPTPRAQPLVEPTTSSDPIMDVVSLKLS